VRKTLGITNYIVDHTGTPNVNDNLNDANDNTQAAVNAVSKACVR